MKRAERNKIFFFAKIIALFIGLVLAICYQFTGIGALALVGLAFFAAAFMMMAVSEIENLVYLQNTKIEAESEKQNQEKTKQLHNQKLLGATKLLLCGAISIFTVVVMFLF